MEKIGLECYYLSGICGMLYTAYVGVVLSLPMGYEFIHKLVDPYADTPHTDLYQNTQEKLIETLHLDETSFEHGSLIYSTAKLAESLPKLLTGSSNLVLGSEKISSAISIEEAPSLALASAYGGSVGASISIDINASLALEGVGDIVAELALDTATAIVVEEAAVDALSSGYFQDSRGRWHRPKGGIEKGYASNKEVGLPEPQNTNNSTDELRRNMEKYKGITKPEEGSWAAHHIVAQGESYPKAQEARDILDKWGIGLDDADNGVYLTTDKGGPGAYHPEIHTNKYYDYVYEQLSGCTSEKEVRSVLQSIGQKLQNGVVIW